MQVIFLSLSVMVLAAAAAKQPPNVLFLMCDSMDGRVLDPTSDVSLPMQMPNLRKLASNGVNFIRAYANSPQCVPSRTSMFTGRHTHHIGTWDNSMGLAANPTNHADLDAGCLHVWDKDTCAEMARVQNVTSSIHDAVEATGCDMVMYGKVDVGGEVIEADDQKAFDPTKAGFHAKGLGAMGRSADIRKATTTRPSANMDSKTQHPEDWKMIDRCMQWLEEHDPADQSSSWLLYCSINIPHPGYSTNSTWLPLVNRSAISVPKWVDVSEMHPADAYMTTSKAMEGDFHEEELLDVRQTWYAMCSETDYMLGLVLDKANATGHLDNTVVIFLSDHGEMNMEHRQQLKNSMYEGSSRVPLIISGPGYAKGTVVTDIVSLIDVYPTLMDIFRGVKPDYLDGSSLLPFLTPSTDSAIDSDRPNFIVSQYHSNMGNTGSYMLRQGQWKYIAYGTYGPSWFDEGYVPQLFDVDADPEEMNDVAAKHPSVVDELDALLRTVVDYPTVDKTAKLQDHALYTTFYTDAMTDTEIRTNWEDTFTGFDDDDYARVAQWNSWFLNATQDMER